MTAIVRSVAPRTVRGRARKRSGGALANVVMLAPFLVLFGLFFLLPIGYALGLSLQTNVVQGLGIAPGSASTGFAGLSNYARVAADPVFLQSIGRVLLYGIVQVPLTIALAVILALLIDSGIVAFARFFRLAFFVPYAIPGVIAVIIWSFIYAPDFSPILGVVRAVGPSDFSFLAPETLLWSIANISTWEHVGYYMIVVLAALQAVPRELFEAARVDGASLLRIALQVKLPLVVPSIVLTLVFAIIGTIQLFSEPLVLKSIATSLPSTYTPNLVIYRSAFAGNDPYYAAALAVALAAFSFVLSFGFLRLVGRKSFDVT